MKPFEFTISKNTLIITLIVLFGSVITYDQIKIRKQETRLNLLIEQNANLLPSADYVAVDTASLTFGHEFPLSHITDSIAEPARIFSVKDYAYIHDPDGEIIDSVECKQSDTLIYPDSGYFGELHFTAYVMDSAVFISHTVTDTLFLFDWDTYESIPTYIVTCDTITGDCYLNMFR